MVGAKHLTPCQIAVITALCKAGHSNNNISQLPVCYQCFFVRSTPGITQVLVQAPPDCLSGHIPKEYRVLFLQLAKCYSRTYLYLSLDNVQGPW